MSQSCNERLSSILLFYCIFAFFLVFSSSTEHIETFQKINDKKKQQKEACSSRQEEKQETQHYEKPLAGISPKKLGLKRDPSFSKIDLTRQVHSI
jgi:hypothetical protein